MSLEDDCTVNAFEYLTAMGFNDLQTTSIVMHALIRVLDIDVPTLDVYAKEVGYTLPLSQSFDTGTDYRQRN